MIATEKPVAVVTGSSQGIGRSIALTLAADGYVVWAVARRRAPLEQLIASGQHGEMIAAPCDLTEDTAVSELAAEIAEKTPRLSALVHCAGSITHGSVADAGTQELRSEFASNVTSAYFLTQLLLPHLTPGGTIVFLNSSQGVRATARTSHYAASMHARRALADSLRDEINERGIRVTSVYPGRTATPRQEAIYARNDWPYHPELLLQPNDIADVVRAILKLASTAEVTDLHIRPATKSY